MQAAPPSQCCPPSIAHVAPLPPRRRHDLFPQEYPLLSFTHLVTGGQVATAIANDDEEFAEFLKEIVGYEAPQFKDVRDHLDREECAEIAAFLRGLADIVEA
jgi:hypothetical protein